MSGVVCRNVTRACRARAVGLMMVLGVVAAVSLTAGAQEVTLQDAAMRGDPEAVKRLIDEGADVNQADPQGVTALHYAAFGGHVEIVELLLDRGADANAVVPGQNVTALHAAANTGSLPVVELLLAHGGDVTLEDSDGSTPLFHAADRCHTPIVKLLLEHGAQVDEIEVPENLEFRVGVQMDGYQQFVRSVNLYRRCKIAGRDAGVMLVIEATGDMFVSSDDDAGRDNSPIRVHDGSETANKRENYVAAEGSFLKCNDGVAARGFIITTDQPDQPQIIEITDVLLAEDRDLFNSWVVSEDLDLGKTDYAGFRSAHPGVSPAGGDASVQGDAEVAIFAIGRDKSFQLVP